MNAFEFMAEKFNATSGKVTKTPENAVAIKYTNKHGEKITIFISPTEHSVEHEIARAKGGETLPGSRYHSIPAKNFEQALFIVGVQANCKMVRLIEDGSVS